ncbi:MAG TPA: GNAT family N-acetyltransferase [Dongiaceae bacterium]
MPDQRTTSTLIAENDLTGADRNKIRAFLTAAYPGYAELWTQQDFWGGPPEHRLLLRDPSGRLVGHLGFARRLIEVDARAVRIAGIGAVAILPEMQGRGIGRHLLAELTAILRHDVAVEFGFLQCRDAVIGFYENCGFQRITQQVRSFDPNFRRWQVDDAAAMILPASATADSWPRHGLVDLMGMPW